MKDRRFFGHPLHPAFAGFPVAFWAGGSLWDVVSLVLGGGPWPRLAFWTLVLGLVASLPALASGFWELVRLPEGHPAEATVWWHGGIMTTALCCVLASVLLRRVAPTDGPASFLAVALAALGAAITFGGSWLGGELVFRHGVGVARAPRGRDGRGQEKT